jgi:hypothetical protein
MIFHKYLESSYYIIEFWNYLQRMSVLRACPNTHMNIFLDY